MLSNLTPKEGIYLLNILNWIRLLFKLFVKTSGGFIKSCTLYLYLQETSEYD